MNPFSASLAVLLAATAGAFPVGADGVLVRVNGVPIRQSEVVERLLKRYGAQAVDEMIDETLLRQAAKKAGVSADDAEVERRLTKLQDQFGSRALFISQLEQAGSSLAKVKEDLSDEIVRERLVVKAKGLSVSDAELKKAFAANKDKLGVPEAVHLRHILVAAESDANEIVAKVKAGADFKALAREKSLAASGKAAGGDYGFVARGMLPAEIEEIAFSMKPGEIRVVPGPRGSHVLQVLETRPAKPAVYAEVKDDLRDMLLSEKIKAAAPQYLQELRSKADIKASDAVPPAVKAN
ncbi:MAG: peptidyl-prolyl cis-trans isomerase [Elusimicrobia bacterium]|nr:peptidyl-prolyl cis-trans isomerase [Elusimicrobiota bacterium]